MKGKVSEHLAVICLWLMFQTLQISDCIAWAINGLMFSVWQPNKELLPVHPQIFWITFLSTENKVTDALPQLMEAFLSQKSEVSVQVIIFWVILFVFFNHWQVICLQSYKYSSNYYCVCIIHTYRALHGNMNNMNYIFLRLNKLFISIFYKRECD